MYSKVVYYCENGAFSNCEKECKYNDSSILDAGANGAVFVCNGKEFVLKEDTKYDYNDDNQENGTEKIEKSLALQGEFDFINWAKDNESEKYKNVAKMHRVKCHDESDNQKCENKENNISLDKTKVVIEKIIPLKSYLNIFITNKCTARAEKVCKENPQENYADILFKLTIVFKKNLIKKLVDAINNLHQLGYCHNDLKPGNIGVSSNNEIKFIDMGSATPIKQQSSENSEPANLDSLYTPNAKGYYLMRDGDLNKGGTPQYLPPMFFTYLGSLTHDKYRDLWSIACVIYDIIKYNPDETSYKTLFYHYINPSLVGKELIDMNQGELKKKFDGVFTNDEKEHFKDQIGKMTEFMNPSLHASESMLQNETIVFNEVYGITNYEELKTHLAQKSKQSNQSEQSNEICYKLKRTNIYNITNAEKDPLATNHVNEQENGHHHIKITKKNRLYSVCEVEDDEKTSGGGRNKHNKNDRKKKGGTNHKIVPGIRTDSTGEYLYITDPIAYRDYLNSKTPQGGGKKKKHNSGKIITKERYDKEKRKLSRNVSHVRKYKTSNGFVYYLFKRT